MQKIDEIIGKVLDIPVNQLTDDLTIGNAPNWDSINQMVLINTIEEELSLELTFEEISEMTSVKRIREIISEKLQS